MRLWHNPKVLGNDYPEAFESSFSEQSFFEARDALTTWEGYSETPLYELDDIAVELGIGRLLYKHEGGRFGLGSFKALGGAYAVYRLTQLSSQDESHSEPMTVCTATDGNHGRSVAWGASLFGLNCHIYIHEHVSEYREQAMKDYGAVVHRIKGNYDDSVRACKADAELHGWKVVSDTSSGGDEIMPLWVMQGYTLMIEELLLQLPTQPTHILVQAGVGALPAAVCAHLWMRLGANRPRFICVESENAACLLDSAEAGELRAVEGNLETLMAGLACGEVSKIAWPILSVGTHDFVAISDRFVAPAMRRLARTPQHIQAGESGVAGLAALLEAQSEDKLLELGIDETSCVLLLGTEGVTDPHLYEKLTNDA